MKQFIFVLFLSVVISPSIVSQTLEDSLKLKLEQVEDTKEKVDLLLEISDLKAPFEGLEEAQSALNLANKLVYGEGIGKSHQLIGGYYYSASEINLARTHLKKALKFFQDLKMYEEQVDVLLILGDNEYFISNFTQAIEYLVAAEKIAIQQKNDFLIGQSNFFLSRIYMDGLEDPEKAISYLRQSLPLIQSNESHNRILDVYAAFCQYFSSLKKPDSLAFYIQKLEENNQEEQQEIKAYYSNIVTENKGHLELMKGDLITAENLFITALENYKKIEEIYAIADCQLILAEIALEQKEWKKAIDYGKEGLQFEALDFKIDALEILKKAYKELDLDSFLLYEEKFSLFSDSLNEKKLVGDINKVINSNELSQKEAQIQEQKKSKLHVLIGGILVSLLFAIALLKFYRRTKKQKAQLIILEEEKNHIKNIFSGNEEELETLREKVTTIERSLVSSQLNYERQQSTLVKVTEYLKNMVRNEKPENLKRQLRSLSRDIESNLNHEDRWELFAKQFEQVHPQFFGLLIKQFPDLTNKDLRLCAYVRLGMDNQEIANILSIESSSVIKARHRMKKKMQLKKEQDINQYLLNL